MVETMDNRIYEQEQNKELEEQLSWKKLTKKITNIDNKLQKLSWNKDWRDFLIRNMNELYSI